MGLKKLDHTRRFSAENAESGKQAEKRAENRDFLLEKSAFLKIENFQTAENFQMPKADKF